MFLLRSDLDRITKAGQRALRTFYGTEDGKAFFKYLKLQYCEGSTIYGNDRETLIHTVEKEFVEKLYKEATGKLILEDQETYTNE